MPAIVHRYMERGAGGFANLTLPSGERILISIAASGLRIHSLIWGGRLPWGRLYAADAASLARTVRVVARDSDRLPELPKDAAMDAFLTMATAALKNPDEYQRPLDGEDFPMSHLTVVTRAALAEPDAASLVRRLSRAAATP